MDKLKLDVLLDINDKDFVKDLFEALGTTEVNIVTPTFDRVDGRTVSYFPKTKEEFSSLNDLSKEALTKIGCLVFDVGETWIHWLYPYEWYRFIPEGLEIITISNKTEYFKRGVTDDDIRYGALSYGFIQQAP